MSRPLLETAPSAPEIEAEVVSDNLPLPETRRRWKRRWTIRLVVLAAFFLALTLFAAANFVLVEVRLLVWSGQLRLSWALLLAVSTGFIAAVLVMRLPR